MLFIVNSLYCHDSLKMAALVYKNQFNSGAPTVFSLLVHHYWFSREGASTNKRKIIADNSKSAPFPYSVSLATRYPMVGFASNSKIT